MLKLILGLLAFAWASAAAAQADHAARLKEGDVVLEDFRFASGERMKRLRIHYATLGTPRRDPGGAVTNAVMVLHGTGRGRGAAPEDGALHPDPGDERHARPRHPQLGQVLETGADRPAGTDGRPALTVAIPRRRANPVSREGTKVQEKRGAKRLS